MDQILFSNGKRDAESHRVLTRFPLIATDKPKCVPPTTSRNSIPGVIDRRRKGNPNSR